MSTAARRPGRAAPAPQHRRHGVAGWKPMTAEEEVAAARRRDAGDRRGRDELIERNLPLAPYFARPFLAKFPREADEIIAAARHGLVHAAGRFDPARGARFATMVKPWVRREVLVYLQDERPLIRVPRHHHDRDSLRSVPHLAADSRRARNLRPSGFGGVGGPADLALGSLAARPTNLGPSAGRLPGPVADALARLDERSRDILHRRFGLAGRNPHTLSQLGALLGYTKERARQLEHLALARVRSILAARGITRMEDL